MDKIHRNSDRNAIVDALRGLAILWIVAYHLWLLTWLTPSIKIFNFTLDLSFLVRDGHLGVELFIFISGFSLFYPFAMSHFHKTPEPKFSYFFKKRILRIVPSCYLGVIGGLIITMLLSPGKITSFGQGVWHVLAHFLFIHNLFYDTYDSLLSVLWMMGMIVQFYLIFPVICRAFRKKPLLTFGLLGLISALYRYLVINCWEQDLTRLISMLPAFLDVFVCGMAAAYIVCYLKQFEQQLEKIRFFATLAALLAFVWFIQLVRSSYFSILNIKNGYGIWQSTNRLLLGLDFLFFTVSATYAYRFFRVFFANPVLKFLAAISYNLYIWHQEIGIIFLQLKLIPAVTPDPKADRHWQIWYTVVVFSVSLVVAVILTYGFERPVTRHLSLFLKKITGTKSVEPTADG